MRGGQQSRLEGGHPFGERPLQVQRSGEPVLGGAHRKLDQPGGPGLGTTLTVRPVRAAGVGSARIAAEAAAGHHLHRGQQCGEGTYHRRLRSALLAPHQDTPDGGVHRVQQQGQPEVVVADDGGERVTRSRAHRHVLPRVLAPGSGPQRTAECPGSRIGAHPRPSRYRGGHQLEARSPVTVARPRRTEVLIDLAPASSHTARCLPLACFQTGGQPHNATVGSRMSAAGSDATSAGATGEVIHLLAALL